MLTVNHTEQQRHKLMNHRQICFSFLLVTLLSFQVNGTCTLNGSDGWYPVYFKDAKSQQWQGIMPDVARLLRSEKDIPIEIIDRVVPWKRLFIALDEGQLGAVGGAYQTQERMAKYTLSVPVVSDDIHIFVAKGNEFEFQQLQDLKGRRGIRPRGSLGEKLELFAKAELKKFKKKRNVNVMFRMLEAGRADYAITSLKTGEEEIKNTPRFSQTISMLPMPAIRNGIHYVFSKSGDCQPYIQAINQALNEFKSDGTIARVVSRYL